MKCNGLILKFSLSVAMCCLSIAALAQTTNVTAATAANGAVPRLINYSGVLKYSDGKTLTTITGVTFLLYKDEQGGAPLWLETQNVTPDRMGRYSVQLGTTSANGLPSDLFVSGEARWLAVQVVNDAEQTRVLLVAVPYAMKAADAETIGGLPPSAFVLAAPPSAETAPTTAENIPAAPSSSSVSPLASSNVTTSGGTASTIPMFTTPTNIQNSILTQTGTAAINVRGTLSLPASAPLERGIDLKLHRFEDGDLDLREPALARLPGRKPAEGSSLQALDMHRDDVSIGLVGNQRGAVIDFHQAAGDGDAALGKDDQRLPLLDDVDQRAGRHRLHRIDRDRTRQDQKRLHPPFLRDGDIDRKDRLAAAQRHRQPRIEEAHMVGGDDAVGRGLMEILEPGDLDAEENPIKEPQGIA